MKSPPLTVKGEWTKKRKDKPPALVGDHPLLTALLHALISFRQGSGGWGDYTVARTRTRHSIHAIRNLSRNMSRRLHSPLKSAVCFFKALFSPPLFCTGVHSSDKSACRLGAWRGVCVRVRVRRARARACVCVSKCVSVDDARTFISCSWSSSDKSCISTRSFCCGTNTSHGHVLSSLRSTLHSGSVST